MALSKLIQEEHPLWVAFRAVNTWDQEDRSLQRFPAGRAAHTLVFRVDRQHYVHEEEEVLHEDDEVTVDVQDGRDEVHDDSAPLEVVVVADKILAVCSW